MAAVYPINKGISRSIEFKGIKAQYISYLAVGLVILLLVFVVLYILGFVLYICFGVVIPSGIGLYLFVQQYSHKYGEHGLTKKVAARQLPSYIKVNTRNYFIRLSEQGNEDTEKIGRNTSHLEN